MTVQLTTRNAGLADLAELLQAQHSRRLDMVVPAASLRSRDGVLRVSGAEPFLSEDGVTDPNGAYRPTEVCDGKLAERLGIPVAYLRRMRSEAVDLYDANVNGWLRGRAVAYPGGGGYKVVRPADPRSFLLRTFRSDDGGEGVARTVLSDRFSVIDNFDVLTAALSGVRDAGVEVSIDGCDLSERRMYVRVVAPQVAALAPELLAGYRSPFSGAEGSDNPTVFAGFVISNSEVGDGAFSIVPRLVVQVCNNGMTIQKDALRKTHLGGKLDEGVIRWSVDTSEKALALVTAQARDAVQTFLDVDYVRGVIAETEGRASAPVADPAKAVEVIGKALAFSEQARSGILDHFIRGGQVTAGGLLNAVTSYAQTVDDADAAADLEDKALRVLELAAR